MSDSTPASTVLRWQVKVYTETEDSYARRWAATTGEKPAPPSDPRAIARQQLALAVAGDGMVMNLDSIEQVGSIAVIVDEHGGWTPTTSARHATGYISTWQCTGHERVGTDADDPILTCEPDDDGMLARVPEPHATQGGSVRVRHGLGGSVTVKAFKPDGTGIGYLFATELDDNTVHVEFFGGTATFHVVRDD